MKNPLLGGQELPRIHFAHEAVPGLVSVVMPAWRAETHIGETLRTVSKQSYSDWEVIVVEDGSADATRQIVATFAADFPKHRILYLSHDRSLGPSTARNTAFAEARGEFVALLDADDHWLTDHLAETICRLRQDRSDIGYSSMIMVDYGSGMPFGVLGPTTAELAVFPRNLLGRNSIAPSSTVLRRQVLEDVGGWHPALRHAEDVFYWLACARAGKTFSYVPGVRCIYTRNRSGSATQQLALTMTSYSWVVESFLADSASRPLPMSEREAIQWIAGRYHTAARTHLKGKRHADPSADPGLAYSCALKAWRAKPLRFRYLPLVIRAAIQATLAGRLAPPQTEKVIAPVADRRRKAA